VKSSHEEGNAKRHWVLIDGSMRYLIRPDGKDAQAAGLLSHGLDGSVLNQLSEMEHLHHVTSFSRTSSFGVFFPTSAFAFISPERVAEPIAIARKFSL
jgi:hypothetical protein